MGNEITSDADHGDHFFPWLSRASATRRDTATSQICPKRRPLAHENTALTAIREIEQNFATAAQSMTKSFREASHRIDRGDQ